jgi:dihydrofolate reductase
MISKGDVMRKVAVNMSMSLGGFIAGPNDSVERLHEWVYELASWRERHGLAGGRADADTEVLDESFKNTGATVMAVVCSTLERIRGGITLPSMCRYSYLVMILQRNWSRKGGTTFTFVADGIESALEQAKAVAGDRDVSLVGGANVIQHSTWAPGYSTTCKFTSCPHCSATVGDCSIIPAPSKSNWRVRG